MNSTTRQLIVLIAVSICCSTSLLAEEVTVMISRPGAPLDSETQAVGGFPIAFGPFFGPGGPTIIKFHLCQFPFFQFKCPSPARSFSLSVCRTLHLGSRLRGNDV